MPNDWFQFKQFKIHQDKCAMKVSTDACIQGAWAAAEFSTIATSGSKVLDIGTGTGLLTLMLAQAMPDAHFDAIEINEEAYHQAMSNFDDTPWKEQLRAHHTSLAAFTNSIENKAKYDFIICNPPFFQNHLESQSKARNDARHSQSMSKEELAISVLHLLKEDGIFSVMFPATEWNNWCAIAEENALFPFKQLLVYPTDNSSPNRVIALMTKKRSENLLEINFSIYDEKRNYKEDMKTILSAYYLAF